MHAVSLCIIEKSRRWKNAMETDVEIPRSVDSDEHWRAFEAAANERFDEAIAICWEAVRRDQAAAWPFEMLGYLFQRTGNTSEAIAALQRATKVPSPKAVLLHALGRLYYRTGAFRKAIDALQRALELDPGRSEGYYLKGLAEYHAGLTRRAIQSFSRAIDLDPSNIVAKYHLAVAHSRAGDLRSAIDALNSVVGEGAEDAAAHYHLGMAHYAVGSMSEAARHFARSIEMDPLDDRSRHMFTMTGDRLSETGRGHRGFGLAGFLRPLRQSLIAKAAIVATLLFVACGGALAWWMIHSADANDAAVVQAKAEAASDNIRATLRIGEHASSDQLQEVVEALGKQRTVLSLRIMSKDGLVLASTDRHEIGTSVPRSDPACISCHGSSSTLRGSWTEVRQVNTGNGSGLELLRPLFAERASFSREASSPPLGMLQMVTSLSETDARRSSRRIYALSIGGAACTGIVLLFAALTWYMVRRPLSILEAAVGRVGAGELDVEIHNERIDEIGRLNSAFNRMTRDLRRSRSDLDEIHHSMEQRIADATKEIQKTNNELREANSKLLEYDQKKSAYIQRAIHDVRSPLQSVIMMQQVLASGLSGTLSEDQRHIFSRMQGRTGAMAQLISDLLHLEQLAARGANPVRARVSLAESIRRAMDSSGVQAEKKKVMVEVSGLEDLPQLIGDPDMIDSITGNLIDNAVKYTNPGGLISIRGRVDGTEVVFEVCDSGIGIPEEERGFLFEAFFRASNALRADAEGTGLGLTITKRMIESLLGSISITSAEGKGTTVTVRLPAASVTA
jgi:signal transduction histidine kinase/cytochrome c-type biogenesis protein CcmH/NrfG